MILVDSSVLIAAEDSEDAHHDASTRTLEREPLATVELAFYEVINVAERGWRNPDAARRLRQRVAAIEAYGRLIRVGPELGEEIARLVREHGLTGYEAAYVAAAQRLGVPLVSCDERDLVSRGMARLPT